MLHNSGYDEQENKVLLSQARRLHFSQKCYNTSLIFSELRGHATLSLYGLAHSCWTLTGEKQTGFSQIKISPII